MVRGCNLSGFSGQIHYYNVIGNLKTGVVAGNPRFIGSINGSTAPAPQSQILAYNRIYGFDAGSDGANLMLAAGKNSITYEAQRGVAIIQNIFERIGTSENGTTLDFNTGDSDAYDNVMIWNNTFMGERQNAAYNSTGSVPKSRYLWSVKNNIWWDWNSKDDTFTGQSGGDGNRIGNWPIIFGVDFSGNVAGDEGADVSDFFPGVKSKHLIWNHSAAGVAADTFKFVDYRANDSVNPGTGNGDYTPTAASPAYNLQYDDLLPYDILGNERGTVDSAGAISTYVAGNTDPVIAITTPANGATEVTPVSVSATATDAEDGDISSSIVWSSNVDGVLGTGSSLSFFLSVGAHTITASITDSSLGVDTASVDITVTAPPSTGDAEAASGSAATVIIQ
jgi:hypothetical protein